MFRPSSKLFKASSLGIFLVCLSGCWLPLPPSEPPPDPCPGAHSDDGSCEVTSLERISRGTSGLKVWSPDETKYLVNRKDAAGVYQIYLGNAGNDNVTCISCIGVQGSPRADRNKMQVQWHPSGRWIIFAGEKVQHDGMAFPQWLREGWLQCGLWMDIYAVSADGSRWYRLAETWGGFTGPAFTPDGTRAVWSPNMEGSIFQYAFGRWRVMKADFVEASGVPALVRSEEITPAGGYWFEPGNFSPDGKRVLLSSDIGIADAQGQDQFTLDIDTGEVVNLTNTPTIWDEHGLFSPDGKKIVFMSAYPYRSDPNASKTFSIRTEFMLMNADGTGLQQLTHFREPGSNEGIAAVAAWSKDGSYLNALTLLFPDYDVWKISFEGACGNQPGPPSEGGTCPDGGS